MKLCCVELNLSPSLSVFFFGSWHFFCLNRKWDERLNLFPFDLLPKIRKLRRSRIECERNVDKYLATISTTIPKELGKWSKLKKLMRKRLQFLYSLYMHVWCQWNVVVANVNALIQVICLSFFFIFIHQNYENCAPDNLKRHFAIFSNLVSNSFDFHYNNTLLWGIHGRMVVH